ncbi:MAG TPA: hypothetical protein VGB06_01435, partial [Solirubrobacterales bacterium]
AVSDLRVARELADRRRVLFRLLESMRDASERSGSGEDTAFPEHPMKEAAGHVAPFLDLALAVDHQINRYIEAPKLPAEPPVLLPAALEVGLYNEQVQIAIRTRLTPRPRAKQNDIRLRSGRDKPAPSLRDEGLFGQCHSVKG